MWLPRVYIVQNRDFILCPLHRSWGLRISCLCQSSPLWITALISHESFSKLIDSINFSFKKPFLSVRPTSLGSPIYSLAFICNCLHVVVQSLSYTQLCDPMDCSTPSFPVLHYLLEFDQTHVHWVDDTNQPSHPLSPPSSPTLSLSQQQGLFQWVGSLHQVAKVLHYLHINFIDWWCAYVSISSTRAVKILKARIVFYSLP